jgi:hypothetical protein
MLPAAPVMTTRTGCFMRVLLLTLALNAGRPNAWLKPWIDNRNRSDIRYDYDDYVMRRCKDE